MGPKVLMLLAISVLSRGSAVIESVEDFEVPLSGLFGDKLFHMSFCLCRSRERFRFRLTLRPYFSKAFDYFVP